MDYIFVTLFPDLIKPYFNDSILKKAIDKKLLNLYFYNPRDFTKDKHKKVDDTIYGGGAGMLLTPQPLFDCLNQIKKDFKEPYFIFLTPAGKLYNQKDAIRLAKKKTIVFVSGRYEGIDERVIEEFADEVIRVGDFILTGGELASLVMADSISRNLDGVLGNSESLEVESFVENLIEAPAFTKPRNFKEKTIPNILASGNHKKISEFNKKLSFLKTQYYKL